jgi:hypothetical protein
MCGPCGIVFKCTWDPKPNNILGCNVRKLGNIASISLFSLCFCWRLWKSFFRKN